jgi:hypothetical protein
VLAHVTDHFQAHFLGYLLLQQRIPCKPYYKDARCHSIIDSVGLSSFYGEKCSDERDIVRKENFMQQLLSLKESAIQSLPDNTTLEDIMYKLYVLDQIRQGQEAVQSGQTTSIDDLKREMAQW